MAPGVEIATAAEPTAFAPQQWNGHVLTAPATFWAAQVFSLIPDTTAPTQTLSVNELTNAAGQFFNTTTATQYYNTGAGGRSPSAPFRPTLTQASPPSLSTPSPRLGSRTRS